MPEGRRASDDTFPTITPHDPRHSAASLAVSAGANVEAVQRMLGHAKVSMTGGGAAGHFHVIDDIAMTLRLRR
jgi:integrase